MMSRSFVDLTLFDTPEKRQAYIMQEFDFSLNLYGSYDSAYAAASAVACALSLLHIISFDESCKLNDILHQKRKESRAAALSA